MLTLAGINDFPNVGEEDIRKALPFLKKAGVPYYVHAELLQNDSSPVSLLASMCRCSRSLILSLPAVGLA